MLGTIAYLGLGSNEGDRLRALRLALDRLVAKGVELEAVSTVYETEPQGEVRDQPDFLNACARVRYSGDAESLLDLCKQVERELGRNPSGRRHGPRPVDVDLLVFGDLVYRSERLVLPHPEIRSRRFVLEPLLELEPTLTLPDDGTPLRQHLSAVREQRVVSLGPLLQRDGSR